MAGSISARLVMNHSTGAFAGACFLSKMCHSDGMDNTDEQTGVPDRYVDEIEGQVPVMHRLEDGWCAALDRNTMMCRIYEVRPLICREFEMGEPDCVDERDKWFIKLE